MTFYIHFFFKSSRCSNDSEVLFRRKHRMTSQQAAAIDVLDDRLCIIRKDHQWMSEKPQRRGKVNMEKDVGSLQEQALKRKERLKALRDKQLHVGILFSCCPVSVKCSMAYRKRLLDGN